MGIGMATIEIVDERAEPEIVVADVRCESGFAEYIGA